MTIRARLTVQFVLLASLILGSAFVVVYIQSASYRSEEFQGRMRDRGTNAANLLIQIDEVNEDLLMKIEQNNPVRLPEESIRIYDHQNKLMFQMGDTMITRVPTGRLDAARLEGSRSSRSGVREELIFPFSDRNEYFMVVVSGNDVYGKSKLRNLLRMLVITFIIGVLATFLIGRTYAEQALKPVKQLVSELRGFEPTDLTHRVTVGSSPDEIAELAGSFNDLLERLQRAIRSQRNFITNASHELRTPLTAISGQVEVMLLKPRSDQEYAVALRSILEDIHALNTLSDRLLLMAQAESEVAAISFVSVRMDEVLWTGRSETLRASPENKVEVAIEEVEEGSDLQVHGNEDLLRSLVVNLLENACKYSPDHRAIVTLSGSAEQVTLEVADQGIGISAEDRRHIFEPFFRASNATGATGHGIGLSLVERIVRLHGAAIDLRSVPGEGSVFTVRFPKRN